MVYFRIRETGEAPVQTKELARRLGVGIGDTLRPEQLDEYGVDYYTIPPKPDHDPATQRVVEGEPEQVDGEWRQTWAVEDRPVTQDDYANAVQRHLDAKARERQYDSLLTAITYRDDPNPQYAAEGQALFEWRSEVWTYALAELAKVHSGEREAPSISALVGELPAFTWPVAQAA